MKVKFRTSLKEATAPGPNAGNNNFQVVLIQEGLGNLKDCFYYTKQCLQSAPSIFEGKKCYADHPSSFEENVRPERSTRDILGYYTNVQYQEGADGRGALVADLITLADPSISWANALLANSIAYAKQYPNSDFVGLSINAAGEADETSLANFVQQNEVPASVMPKLQEAVSQGVDTIRVVSALQEAVSCDLVTDAGAGGKILKMIEQEKKRPMKNLSLKEKNAHEKEKEKKEAGINPKDNLAEAGINPKDNLAEANEKEAGEDGTGMNPNPLASGATPNHADADQDTALFQQLIAQYLGADHGADPAESMQMCKQAYECAKESGMDHESAMQAAGTHLKMAHAIGQKQAANGGGMMQHEAEKEAEETHEADEHKEAFPPAAAGKKPTPPSAPAHAAPAAPLPPANTQQMPKAQIEKYYESMRNRLITLTAENTKLRESLNRHDLSSYFEKKMRESKLPNHVTKSFRESIGVVRNRDEIDRGWKLFLAGREKVAEEVGVGFSDCLFVEKNQSRSSDTAEGGVGGFADCL